MSIHQVEFVRSLLEAMRGGGGDGAARVAAARRLFAALNYRPAQERLPGRLSSEVAAAVIGGPVIIAIGGEGGAFVIVHVQLAGDALGRDVERGVVTSLMTRCPHALFVFSNRDHSRWRLINATTESRRPTLRRISIAAGERLRTASERIARLDLNPIVAPRGGASAASIQHVHVQAFDVDELAREFLHEYKRVFADAERSLSDVSNREAGRLVTQRLFNRLMSHAFVRKQGWTPPPDDELGPVPAATVAMIQRELFDRFDFTLAESTSLDRDLAIDPEMLGTVFESLVTGRHESGSYYTPKPVVAFMCREALKVYLESACPREAESAVAGLVDERDAAGIDDGESVLAALKRVRCCDPACGSGAYLIGMLHELMDLRGCLADAKKCRDEAEVHGRKRQIIESNLWGIDIDPSAVHIARLRMGLCLATETAVATGSREPLRLPTPRVNVSQGDSLLDADQSDAADGFDIVITNPPYVRHELIPRQRKALLLSRYGDGAEAKSDLYCYFYLRAQQLLRPGGVQVLVCSNTWLDVGYGTRLKKDLLEHSHIRAIYESAVERQFSTADVNTIISVIQRRRAAEADVTRFVSFQLPFAHPRQASSSRQEVTRTRRALRRSAGEKWGGRLLRAPQIFSTIIAAPNAIRLGECPLWRIGRGRRTGCDDFFYLTSEQVARWQIEPCFLKTLIKSPVDFRGVGPRTSLLATDYVVFLCHEPTDQLRGTNALDYVRHGRSRGCDERGLPRVGGRWYDLGRQAPADLILSIAFHERFFVVVNDAAAQAHQRFATLILNRDAGDGGALRKFLAAVLTSAAMPLMAEVLGRRGLGQGALDFPPDDWRQVVVPDPRLLCHEQVSAIIRCWDAVASLPPQPWHRRLLRPEFRDLDEAVLFAYGLEGSRRAEICDAVTRITTQRLGKASRARAIPPAPAPARAPA